MKIAPFAANCAVLLAATSIHAQSTPLTQAEAPSENHFGLSARFGLNISAKFKNLGGFTSPALPGPASGGAEHFYDDGFVRLDASGNAGGKTWFWGYENAAQVPGNDTIEFHAGDVPANRSVRDEGDPQLGFELSYSRQLGKLDPFRWGIEAAFGYTDINIRNSQSFVGNVTALTDSYALGGVTPPQAPYAGTFGGPGVVIGDTPTRSTTLMPGGALITGQRELNAGMYTLRLGPYFTYPITERLSLDLGGGLAFGIVDSEFEFREAVTVGAATAKSAGHDSQTDFLAGGYVGAQLGWQVFDHVSLFTGAQYQPLGSFTQKVAGKKAELDLVNPVFLSAGLRFSF